MKLITILGQTSSGKSEYAVNLATELTNTVIYNCDSRQIYKGLNIGTGKVHGTYKQEDFVYKNIIHRLIDYVSPENHYTLVQYLKDFKTTVENEDNRIDTILLVGGTGLYAEAIIQQYELFEIKEKFQAKYSTLKQQLGNFLIDELWAMAGKQETTDLNNSDWHNPYRLINYILRRESLLNDWGAAIEYPQFETVEHTALHIDQEVLKQQINARLQSRYVDGLIEEVQKFQYLGNQRLQSLGLEYALINDFLHGDFGEQELKVKLYQANINLAKRQLTWLKKRKLTWIQA
jgi:tRNA dimethylallyltransferase